MSASDVELVRSTLAQLDPTADAVVRRFYGVLFEWAPELESLFVRITPDRQAQNNGFYPCDFHASVFPSHRLLSAGLSFGAGNHFTYSRRSTRWLRVTPVGPKQYLPLCGSFCRRFD